MKFLNKYKMFLEDAFTGRGALKDPDALRHTPPAKGAATSYDRDEDDNLGSAHAKVYYSLVPEITEELSRSVAIKDLLALAKVGNKEEYDVQRSGYITFKKMFGPRTTIEPVKSGENGELRWSFKIRETDDNVTAGEEIYNTLEECIRQLWSCFIVKKIHSIQNKEAVRKQLNSPKLKRYWGFELNMREITDVYKLFGTKKFDPIPELLFSKMVEYKAIAPESATNFENMDDIIAKVGKAGYTVNIKELYTELKKAFKYSVTGGGTVVKNLTEFKALFLGIISEVGLQAQLAKDNVKISLPQALPAIAPPATAPTGAATGTAAIAPPEAQPTEPTPAPAAAPKRKPNPNIMKKPAKISDEEWEEYLRSFE